jgi:arginine-tRNA-protein transferase
MQGEVPQPQICGPSDDSSAKVDHHESPSDEDDNEDFNDYESDMMVDEEIIHSEKPDTTEGSSNINDIKNITLDLNGSRVKYKVHTQNLTSNRKDDGPMRSVHRNRSTSSVGTKFAFVVFIRKFASLFCH